MGRPGSEHAGAKIMEFRPVRRNECAKSDERYLRSITRVRVRLRRRHSKTERRRRAHPALLWGPAPSMRMFARLRSSVFAPMPFTLRKSSADLNAPFFSR